MTKKADTTEALATKQPEALARPDWVKTGDTRGTDHITKDDLVMPRLALGQGLTPQVIEQKDGFGIGVLFNTITEEVYGKGPIEFAIVRADRPRWIEFRPREEGGGIIDMNVLEHDQRTRFGPNGEAPVATKFYDFFIALLPLRGNPMESVICLSMKSTALKAARQLNTFIKLRNAPLFAGKYVLTTGVDKNDKGVFAVYVIKNAGWVDEQTGRVLEGLYDALRDREIKVEREPGDDSFEPEQYEQGAEQPEM